MPTRRATPTSPPPAGHVLTPLAEPIEGDLEIPPSAAVDRFGLTGFLVAHAGMIAFLTVVYLNSSSAASATVVVLAAASVVIALVATRAGWREDDPGSHLKWFGVWATLVLLWIGMVSVYPFYLQSMFTLFPLTFVLISSPGSLLAALVLPATWGVEEFLDEGSSIWAWVVLPGAVWALSCVFALWINGVIDQSEERGRLLDELAATRAVLAAVERDAGIQQERARMAREIHDTLAQGFTSIVLHARGALARGDAEQALATLQLVESVASEHLDEARRLVRPESHESIGERSLIEAIRRVAIADEPHAHVHIDGEPSQFGQLGGAIEVAVLRIVQEAVANARKHSGAERIDVSLALAGDRVLVDVVDDGCGFETGAGTPAATAVAGRVGGHGLPGLRQRVAELDGDVEIESTLGSGTTVSVALAARAR